MGLTEAPAILQFDLEPGQNADAILASRALIAWVEAIQEAATIIDPIGSASVDLLSAEAACRRFSTVLRFAEQKLLLPVAMGLTPYPRLKQLIALNVLILPGAIAGGVAVALLTSSPEAQKKQAEVARSPVVQQKVRSFYKIVG